MSVWLKIQKVSYFQNSNKKKLENNTERGPKMGDDYGPRRFLDL